MEPQDAGVHLHRTKRHPHHRPDPDGADAGRRAECDPRDGGRRELDLLTDLYRGEVLGADPPVFFSDLHWDGEACRLVDSPVHDRITDIHGRARDDIWAVSEDRILHWDGSRWRGPSPPRALPIGWIESPTRPIVTS